ncbi:hypothetical protein WA026_008181 [Henosepilachna vigintioctopunctata]|uniref:CYTH domain-containing protein n=1 Tax=Henosepilachna vigintioctopunctata TaxID=420089 RepID=A0AAW1TR64_9CUCU
MRNVEIKALIRNPHEVNRKLNELGLEPPTLINQHDDFQNIPHGRLKLRSFEDNSGELIHYERSDNKGPKLSSFNKANLCAEPCEDMSKVFKRALGFYGEVKKVRHLYILWQTRIHIDFVEGLGNYLELEVVLEQDQSVEDGEKVRTRTNSVISQLNIDRNDFVATAYVDVSANKK